MVKPSVSNELHHHIKMSKRAMFSSLICLHQATLDIQSNPTLTYAQEEYIPIIYLSYHGPHR